MAYQDEGWSVSDSSSFLQKGAGDTVQMEGTGKETPPPATTDLTKPESKTSKTEEDFEKILENIGGHGPFQVFVWVIGFGGKASVAGVFLYMSFAGATPDFWCSPASGGNGSDVRDDKQNVQNGSWDQMYKACDVNGTSCSSFIFEDDINTIVNTWRLVCSDKWVSSTITSAQMAGVLLGAFTAGQVADMWGRRKTSMALLLGQVVFTLANAFSPNWIFFIVTRMGAGFSGGGVMVPYFSLTMEFTDIRWRAFLGAIPSWPIGAGLMSLAAWLLHDWQYLGVYVAAFSMPFLIGWWFMPESVRWLLVHERVEEAQAILCRAATWNGTQAPDETVTRKLAAAELAKAKNQRLYTFRDLFRTRQLAKTTCLLFIAWFSSGLVYYFLAFGAETLSGNLYLNICLLSVVEVPAMLLSCYLNNKLGRRWTSFLLYLGAGLCSLTVVILIHTGAPGSAVNGMVLASKLTLGGGWGAVLVFSAESFPTVIRNIGYGAVSTAARLGSIVAPQLVFLYDTHPSIPYVVVTVLMVASSLSFLKIRETNEQALEDVLPSPSTSVHTKGPAAQLSVSAKGISASQTEDANL